MKYKKINTAILLIGFNRPENIKRLLNILKKTRVSRLYISIDGPRKNNNLDQNLIDKHRILIKNINWPCSVKALFNKKNLGCGKAVKNAIDWFFRFEKQGIILEDDLIPSNSFFFYCEELLNRYSKDDRIGMISGNNLTNFQFKKKSYLFSKHATTWGWASWRRAWKNYEFYLNWNKSIENKNIIRNGFVTNNFKSYLYSRIDYLVNRLVDTWDYQWSFTLYSQNQLCIIPKKNLVKNIGFDQSATHTKSKIKFLYNVKHEIQFPLIHQKYTCPDYDYDNIYEKLLGKRNYIPIFLKRLKKKLNL